MDIMKCITGALAGGAVGFVAAFVLFIPACMIGAVFGGKVGDKVFGIANDIFWLFIFGGAIVGFLRSFAEEKKKEAERERAERERRRYEEGQRWYEEKQERAEQTSIYSSLVQAATTSLNLFESMPGHLVAAEELLDQAEHDFKEGAFSPFWSSIEKTTMRLGTFDDGVRMITINFKEHGELAKRYKGTLPRFPIVLDSIRGMAAANTTTDRLNRIVRKAQRNFQFATIYEQRKTNQLLAAGFTTLAQALDGMGHRIASSIDDLGGRLSEMSTAMENSLNAIGEQLQSANQSLVESVDALHDTTKESASAVKERHDRALEMLDNIQRRDRKVGSV